MSRIIKIKVTHEGRPNIFIPEKESLKEYILSKDFDAIHNFIEGEAIILGADHGVESVLEDIENGERIAIFTNGEGNMGHSLSIVNGRVLECYDIGIIKESDLNISNQLI